MSEPQLTVAPTTTPISVPELRTHLRITVPVEDQYLSDLIDVAVNVLQEKAWRQYCTATYTLKFDDWAQEMFLPKSPLASVGSITYLDIASAQQTLSTDIYEVVTDQTPGLVRLKFNQTFPTLQGHPDDITITFTCGTTVALVPSRTKQAVLLMAAHMYHQRTLIVVGRSLIAVEIPMGIMFLLDRAGVPL